MRLIRVLRELGNGEQIVFALSQHRDKLKKNQWNGECQTQEETLLSQMIAALWESQTQDVQGFELRKQDSPF